MELRRFSDHGVEVFSNWLNLLRDGQSLEPPMYLLTDAMATESLGTSIDVRQEFFASRFDAAKSLVDSLSVRELDGVEYDRGLWAWLSLFYIESVLPVINGQRLPGAEARYIPESKNFQRYYRHLLAGPYRIYRAYKDVPEIALSLLCQPVHLPGDVVEQIASRQERVTNHGVVGLATRLYVDAATRRLKRGASGKGAGSVRRLIDYLDQIDLTWDIAFAEPIELARVLPQEFSKFQT